MLKSVLFASRNNDISQFLNDSFYESYRPIILTPDSVPELPGPEAPIQLLVVTGYSIKEAAKKIPALEDIVRRLPARLPRLYLLQEADPSLSLVPLKGDRQYFYLRGPLSTRALKKAIDQILSPKPRARRRPVSPDLGIMASFSLHTHRDREEIFVRDVVEISPSGFSFLWLPSDPLIFPGDMLMHLELRTQERPFLHTCAQIRHLTLAKRKDRNQGMRVGAEFIPDAIIGPDGVETRAGAFLSDAVVIKTVLADAVERKTLVLIHGEQPGWEVQGLMTGCDTIGRELTVSVISPELPEELECQDIVSCQFVRDNAQLRFWSVLMSVDADSQTLTFRFPKRLDKLWARTTLRYEFSGDDAPIVELHTPIMPESPVIRRVINLSPHGLCLEVEPDEDMVVRGMRLNHMVLTTQSGLRLRLEGQIRYIAGKGGGQDNAKASCGIQFDKLAPSDRHALVDYLISKNYPRVRDATPQDEADLWAFYLYADFLTPAKQDASIGTLQEVRETQAKMLAGMTGLSRKLIYKDGDRIFGTVALQQICQRTWLVHHLCAVRHRSEFVPKSLLLFLGEYISKTPEIEYIKMMWRPNNTWSNKMFGRLVHRLHDGEQSVVKIYSYLFHDGSPLPPPRPEVARWTIRPIEPDEISELESYFINQEEYFLMRSEDLFRDGLDLEQIDAQYQKLGLFRKRKVFVAFEGEHLAGFSVAEHASPGLNLSNLLNAFQVHVCYPRSEGDNALKEALIRHTTHYYHENGQLKTVAFSEESDLSAFQNVGFIKKKEYVSWTFDHNIANIYNLYCYYIFRIYERIEARRQELRERSRR